MLLQQEYLGEGGCNKTYLQSVFSRFDLSGWEWLNMAVMPGKYPPKRTQSMIWTRTMSPTVFWTTVAAAGTPATTKQLAHRIAAQSAAHNLPLLIVPV